MKVYYTKDVDGNRSEDVFKLVTRRETMYVPKSEYNRHYQMIQEWLEAGNVIEDEPESEEG